MTDKLCCDLTGACKHCAPQLLQMSKRPLPQDSAAGYFHSWKLSHNPSYRPQDPVSTQLYPRQPMPPPKPIEHPQVWLCCKCGLINTGKRHKFSICSRDACNHVSCLHVQNRDCGYCGDYLAFAPGDEFSEDDIVNDTSEVGWYHDDIVCIQYHFSQPEKKDCVRCEVNNVDRSEYMLVRSIDKEGREPTYGQ